MVYLRHMICLVLFLLPLCRGHAIPMTTNESGERVDPPTTASISEGDGDVDPILNRNNHTSAEIGGAMGQKERDDVLDTNTDTGSSKEDIIKDSRYDPKTLEYRFYNDFFGADSMNVKTEEDKEIDLLWKEAVDEMVEKLEAFLESQKPCLLKKFDEANEEDNEDRETNDAGIDGGVDDNDEKEQEIEDNNNEVRMAALESLERKMDRFLRFKKDCIESKTSRNDSSSNHDEHDKIETTENKDVKRQDTNSTSGTSNVILNSRDQRRNGANGTSSSNGSSNNGNNDGNDNNNKNSNKISNSNNDNNNNNNDNNKSNSNSNASFTTYGSIKPTQPPIPNLTTITITSNGMNETHVYYHPYCWHHSNNHNQNSQHSQKSNNNNNKNNKINDHNNSNNDHNNNNNCQHNHNGNNNSNEDDDQHNQNNNSDNHDQENRKKHQRQNNGVNNEHNDGTGKVEDNAKVTTPTTNDHRSDQRDSGHTEDRNSKNVHDGSCECRCSKGTPRNSQSETAGNCHKKQAHRRPCIDMFREESVMSQVCSRMASIEEDHECVTSRLKANQNKADETLLQLHNEVKEMKNTIELLQRSSMFYAEASSGSGPVVKGYRVMVTQGQGFDPVSGYFNVPYDGTYQITLGYAKRFSSEQNGHLNVLVESKTIFRLNLEGANQNNIFMASLKSGQSMWLKISTNSGNDAGDRESDTIIFGVLLIK